MKKIIVIRMGIDNTHKEYRSVADAAKDVGGQGSHISECARNIAHRKTHKGYMWAYRKE